MPLVVVAILILIGIVLYCVVAATIYPKVGPEGEAQGEQDITGVGPDARFGSDPRDTFLG